jgi:fibronectin-binding autotransporter adhesin
VNGVASATLTMNGVISENTPGCGITKAGLRRLVLNGANTFTGGVVLNSTGGLLVLGNDNALGPGTLRIYGGTMYVPATRVITNNVDLMGSFTFGKDPEGPAGLHLNTPGVVTLKSNVSITLSQSSLTSLNFNTGLGEDMPGRGLTVENPRAVAINGDSTFTGTLTIDNGALLTANGTMAAGNVVMYQGMLKVSADNPVGTGTLTVASSGTDECTIAAVGARRVLDNDILMKGYLAGGASLYGCDFNRNRGSATLTGDLIVKCYQGGGVSVAPYFWRGIQESGGSWGVRLLSGGANRYLILGGTSTYSGATIISRSILQVVNANALPTNTALSIAYTSSTDGVFDMNSKATRIGSLYGAGYVLLGSGTLTIGGSQATTFSGVMTGSGGLIKTGGGTQVLASAMAYTGPTVVNDGILRVNGVLNSGGSLVTSTAAGILAGTGTVTRAVLVDGGGISAGNAVDTVGELTVNGSSGTAGTVTMTNDARVVWLYDAVTNNIIKTKNLVFDGPLTLMVNNLGRNVTTAETFTVMTFTGSQTGFNPAQWTIDGSASAFPVSTRLASLSVSGNAIVVSGLKAPPDPVGSVILFR